MPCLQFKSNGLSGFLCYSNAYKYKGFLFEWHNYCGPMALRKDFEPRKNIPKGFWDMANEFGKLPKEERKQYLI